MQPNILSYIFLDLYNDSNNGRKGLIEFGPKLESILEDYLVSVLGFRLKNNYSSNLGAIKIYFQNIIDNINYNLPFEEGVKEYANKFNKILEDHKYLNLFIEAMERIYDKSYDGRITYDSNNLKFSYENIMAIKHKDSTLTLGRVNKKNDLDLPEIHIYDMDNFERILKQYAEAVVRSDSFYNLFSNNNFEFASFDEKIKMLFECTMFNAMSMDATYIEDYFSMYTDFITDDTFKDIKRPTLIGNMFDDDLYVMSKRSELEYETPYYLAFMLNKKRIELPNIRMGIQNKDGVKVAHIIAAQSSQITQSLDNLNELQREIKNNLPTDPNFRFYNPTHLVSILLTFGMLNGIGIKKVYVKDYMPFRYNKTSLDRQFSESESENYQTRLTNKNLNTYMRLIELADGIDLFSYPELGDGLIIQLDDSVNCKNDFLQKIYDKAYTFGKEISNIKEENNKHI